MSLADPDYLAGLRRQMLRFAMLQLNDAQSAEDAVQEALVGALQSAGAFARRAALKTWVFSILKYKIADALRQRARWADARVLLGEEGAGDDDLDALFDQRGHWQVDARPVAWPQPAAALESDHFWRVFEACLDGLPAQQGRVFMMREFLELDSTEICDALEITTSNLHTTLFRARLRLRECLQRCWFSAGETL